MDVWHYKSRGKLHALTADEHGSNLPDNLGPWTLLSPVSLIGQDNDEREAISLVTECGYCCFE